MQLTIVVYCSFSSTPLVRTPEASTDGGTLKSLTPQPGLIMTCMR
jgi:hypothetical protein